MALNARQADIPERPQAPCPDKSAEMQSQVARQKSEYIQPECKTDIEYYRSKSESLSLENDALRDRLASLEDVVRRMESKLEDQGQRLQHAEINLRFSGASG